MGAEAREVDFSPKIVNDYVHQPMQRLGVIGKSIFNT
jgi:hypothetical protein